MSTSKLISNVQCPEKYVGYADLPNQIYRHCAMNGFDFNLMVVGESGLGKSTFINNLFTSDVYVQSKYADKTPSTVEQTMEIRSSFVTISESGVQLRLGLIDTPGYGDNINNAACWETILSFVTKKHDEYLKWENSSPRIPIRDMRVHCCIYFIAPTGHRLKPIDIDLLKKLHEKVHIIPVIGKSDTLNQEDLLQFKKRILEDLKLNSIKTYDFPNIIPTDDEERDMVKTYLNKLPFGIVSSNSTMDINGKMSRVRKYPWGVCEVENIKHCDFIALRDLLLRTCVCHLIETTHSVLYEKFRSSFLGDDSSISKDLTGSPLEALEAEQAKQTRRLENTKKEMQKLYTQKEEEFKLKLIEVQKSTAQRLSVEETKLSACENSFESHHSNGLVVNVDKNKKVEEHSEDKDKAKKSKRKIF